MTTMFDFSAVYQAYKACRRGKRSSHNTQRYEVSFLQLDIRNFFNRIDRRILLNLLLMRLQKALKQQKVDASEYHETGWLCTVLLQENAAMGAVRRGTPASFAAVPAYKQLGNAPDGCGIAIGNLTSQFFANVYLNELDQFIKHDLKCRYYLRYVDDFVLLHQSDVQLKQWRNQIQTFLADRLGLELKELNKPVPVSSGCDFLGYVTRPSYRLVRRRAVHHCEETLRQMEKHIVSRQGNGIAMMLKKAHRQQLRASLSSYFGHFLHASSFNLEQSIFSRFPWLNVIFELHSTNAERRALQPLWQPLQVISFRSQWFWFHQRFAGVVQLIQLGKSFACATPDIKYLPERVQKMMQVGKPLTGFDAMRFVPLAALKSVRTQLRHARLAHLFVAEEGYLSQSTLSAASSIHHARGGMKRRVLRLLWLPEN